MKESVLSPGYAMSLGELLIHITAKRKVRWMDSEGSIREGELRSLVKGRNNFALLSWGTDVRDAHVWITGNGMETTESVEHLVDMMQQGGYETL